MGTLLCWPTPSSHSLRPSFSSSPHWPEFTSTDCIFYDPQLFCFYLPNFEYNLNLSAQEIWTLLFSWIRNRNANEPLLNDEIKSHNRSLRMSHLWLAFFWIIKMIPPFSEILFQFFCTPFTAILILLSTLISDGFLLKILGMTSGLMEYSSQ